MQKVVITGGLGFIGSHVVDALLAAGRDVTVIDSMVAAVTDGREYEAYPRCVVHRVSIADYFAGGGDFEGVDLVVHAASHVGPAGILRHQGTLGVDIVTTTQQVVNACVDSGAALAHFSSAEVYGRSGMLAEADDLIVPTHYNVRLEYAIAKTLTEAITINSRHRGLRGLVIRPFNVAGPRQSRAGGFVMPTFVQQAIAGRPLTVFASGDQERAFLSRDRPRALHQPSTSRPRFEPSVRSSTSATRPTRPRCGSSPSGSSSASAARRRSSTPTRA